MRKLVFMIMLILLFTNPIYAYAAPIADHGVFDLREISLDKAGSIDLRGEWGFYWGAFVEQDELAAHERSWIQTPSTWGSQPLNIEDRGYGTYHLKILLSENDVGRSIGLYLPSMASAFDLYINGEKLASNGQIGTNVNEMTPAALKQTLYFTPDSQEVDLVIHVSNFNQRKGGIWDSLKLGTADQISEEREQRILFQAFIATGLLLMGIYHTGLYFFRSEKSTLYFGLASLLLFFRTVFVGEFLAVQLIPDLPWELVVKIEYMSVFIGISCLVLYFHHLYDNNMRRVTSYTFALFMVGISLPILVLPASIYTEWMVFYQLVLLLLVVYIAFGLARAALHRRLGARLNFLTGLIFLATVLNDILYYNFIVESIDLVTLGLFLFIFTQMFMLANKFASAYQETETLKDALEKANENLETIVYERTKALDYSNKKLIEAEQARKDLLSSITHELGNPMTSIIGYLTAMKDGVSEESKERHLQIVYRNALKLERMTDDLRLLVQLEQHQLTFEMKLLDLRVLIDGLKRSYDWDMLDRKIKVELNLCKENRYFVKVDAGRIEQVFVNLINNALTHTKPSDQITIMGRYFSFAEAYVIAIQDTGTGIMKKDQQRLFERFYRVKQIDHKQQDGSGLGLTISKTIIEAHQGRIGVRSEYGKGSTFYFILPMEEVREL